MINKTGILAQCNHKYKIIDKFINFMPETTQYFEEELKNHYKKTHCIGYDKKCYYILQCQICGQEIEVLEEQIKDILGGKND